MFHVQNTTFICVTLKSSVIFIRALPNVPLSHIGAKQQRKLQNSLKKYK
jgi:hypothetical protein